MNEVEGNEKRKAGDDDVTVEGFSSSSKA
jgi:hypothetical protein